jgi:hypothetical protein
VLYNRTRRARRINSFGVIDTMAHVMLTRGVPEHVRSGNGAEMTAKIVRSWFVRIGARTLIESGSAWENGYCESFNGKLRDELLNGEIFYSLKEVTVVVEQWRKHYNTIRPQSSLHYRPASTANIIPGNTASGSEPGDAVVSVRWSKLSVKSRRQRGLAGLRNVRADGWCCFVALLRLQG